MGEEEIKKLPDFIQSLGVVYFPQLGYSISIHKDSIPPRLTTTQIADLILQFSSEDTHYFKNARMHELDDRLGDVFSQIVGSPCFLCFQWLWLLV